MVPRPTSQADKADKDAVTRNHITVVEALVKTFGRWSGRTKLKQITISNLSKRYQANDVGRAIYR
jgi:hypothetical protein